MEAPKNLKTSESKTTFTPRQAAAYTGFGITATYKLLRHGSMPSIRVGNRFYVPRVALEKWLESCGKDAVA